MNFISSTMRVANRYTFLLSLAFLGSLAFPFEAQKRNACKSRNDSILRCQASTFGTPEVLGVEVISVTAEPFYNFTVANYEMGQGLVTIPPQCYVNIAYTHPGFNDVVNTQYRLPLEEWNGRFVGLGGGGFAGLLTSGAENSHAYLGNYATAGTGSGHVLDPSNASAWALTSPGNVNYHLLEDFGSTTLDDLPKIAKQVITSYYGTPPVYSYFSGCSGGGRQGMASAQRYPTNYDGILALAPANSWTKLFSGLLYAQIVMNVEGHYPSPCELDSISKASVQPCDGLDGVIDGVVSRPELCDFDMYSLVGSTLNCSEGAVTVTAQSVDIVAKILAGPKYPDGSPVANGFSPGSELSYVGNSSVDLNGDGTRDPYPVVLTESWYRHFVEKSYTFDYREYDYTTFAAATQRATQEFGSFLNMHDPNLTNFKAAGAKLLTWHGSLDNLIPLQDTTQYYDNVKALHPDVDDFYRVFVAPGLAHCTVTSESGGYVPADGLATLAAWVENGTAPARLEATNHLNGFEQPLCPYPKVAKWDGTGLQTEASSYTCVDVD